MALGCTWNISNMAWSSCTVLWQCMGQSPLKSRKRKKSVSVSLNWSRVTSFLEISTVGTPFALVPPLLPLPEPYPPLPYPSPLYPPLL